MTDNRTTLAISGKLNYTDEITMKQAAEIIVFLDPEQGESASPGKSLFGYTTRSNISTKQVENARDSIDVSRAKTNPEKIVALGAYVLQDGGQTFKVDDVKAQFRRAREAAPGNFGRDLSTAIAAGWIAESGDGEYHLTMKVDGIFDGNFSFPKNGNGAKPRGASKSRSNSGKKIGNSKVSKPAVFDSIDVFHIAMDGVQPYSKMKMNKEKLLWVLKFAKKNGVVGLMNKDIEWVTDHLGAGIPNKQITAAFNSAKRSGYANKSTQDHTIRITDEGEVYIESVGASTSVP